MILQNFTAVNRRLEEERRKQYCGTASLQLASLQYEKKPHADTMKKIFRQERGCRKEDNRHHAKALISQQDLQAAMLRSSVRSEMLMANALPYPELEFPPDFKIECIEGHDRLAAADEVLQGSKKRWIVDLYLDNLSNELRMLLADGYDYQKIPDDGEVYIKIRQFQGYYGDANPFFENLWLARLATNVNSQKLFDQLTKHKKFSAAFDKLLDIPGLFGGFRLSVIHQLLSMKCDEPNLAYLEHIYKWWSDLFEDNKEAMRQVTRDTVVSLQGMAPGACFADYKMLLRKITVGEIFENFSVLQREELWERVCGTSKHCLIPSLFTFFEDRKFLSDAAGAIRKVLDVNRKGTITGCLEEIFSDIYQEKDKCVIQLAETTFRHIAGDRDTRLDLGIRQIWLAAFRNCREMPADTQKRDILALSRTKTDKTALYELASLASHLGFESDKLDEFSRISTDREIAKSALLNARKPGRFKFRNQDRCIEQIVSLFESAVPVSINETADTALETIRENDQPPNRYGRPNNADYEFDKTRLFLPHMRDDVDVELSEMTSTFVRWSVYYAYFGSPPPMGTTFREDDPAMLGVEFGECEEENPTIEDQGRKDIVQQIEENDLLLEGQKRTLRDEKANLKKFDEWIIDEGTNFNELGKKLTNQQKKVRKTLPVRNAEVSILKEALKKSEMLLNKTQEEFQEEQRRLDQAWKNKYEAQIAGLREEIQRLQQQNQDCKDNHEAQIAGLQEEIQGLQQQDQNCKNNHEAQIAGLQEEIQRLQQQDQDCKNNYEAQIAGLQEEIQRLQQQDQDCKNNHEAQISGLQESLQQQLQKENSGKEVQSKKEELTQLQNSIENYQRQLKNERIKLGSLKHDVELTSNEMRQNGEEIKQLRNQLDEKRKELEEVDTELAKIREETQKASNNPYSQFQQVWRSASEEQEKFVPGKVFKRAENSGERKRKRPKVDHENESFIETMNTPKTKTNNTQKEDEPSIETINTSNLSTNNTQEESSGS
ncbi:hypothetical protein V8C42DRAFT_336844 [Trichoderma barbatum]